MDRFLLVVALAVLLACEIASESGTTPGLTKPELPKPGFRTRITQRGLDYARDMGLQIVSKEIQNLKIPDVEAQIGNSRAKLHHIKLVKQPTPTATVVPVPGLGIRLVVSDINAEIEAQYTAHVKMSFFKMRKVGTVAAVTENMTFTLDTRVGRDSEGRPNLYEISCKGSGAIKLTFKGDWSSILNFGSKVFRTKIRILVIQQICANTVKEVKLQIAQHPLPVRETVAETVAGEFELDFSMVRFPKFAPDYVELYSKGEINVRDEPTPMPFSPPDIPQFLSHKDKMAYVYVTDYLLNSGCMAAFDKQQLSGYVNESVLPDDVKEFMRTTCPMSLCLGTILPNIGTMYPGSVAHIHVYATRSPVVHVRGPNIGVAGWGVVNVTVTDAGGEQQPVMSATLSGTANFTVHVSNSRVFFNIVKLNPKATDIHSAIDDNGLGSILEPLLSIASEGFLMPSLTDLGFEGIPLPKVKDLRFTDTSIVSDATEHIVIVGTDVRLEPYDQDDEDELQQTLAMFQTLPKLSLSTNWAKEDIEASGDLT